MAVSKEETGQELRHEMLRGVDAVLFDLDG